MTAGGGTPERFPDPDPDASAPGSAARPDDDLVSLSATDLVEAYRSGTLSPVEVTAAVLTRIDALQPVLNCFYRLDAPGARAAARASEARWRAGEPAGPIDGVPFTVKENIAVAGLPRPSGSAAFADAPPEPCDGPATARSREAGGVLLGTTVMPDLGMLSSGVSSLHGLTRSPWNPAWSVGGSSAGAGAAAAARLGPLHVGSDIGGSLRLPAAWGALVTLKASHGRVPVDPPYMGRVAGPIARTTDDVALYLSVLARPDARDYTALGPGYPVDWTDLGYPAGGPAGLRVGFHLTAGAGTATDPEVAGAVRAAAGLFAGAGADVEEIDPFCTPRMLADLDLFLRARSWADVAALGPERRDAVHPFVRDWVRAAAELSGAAVIAALAGIGVLRRATVAATARFDLVLSPVAPMATFPAHWPMPSNDPATSLDHCAYTAPYNFSEQPASSVNAGFTSDGRAIGLQIAGRRFDDLGVLRATRWFEGTRPNSATPVWPD